MNAKKINANDRNIAPGPGVLQNTLVKAGDFNLLVDDVAAMGTLIETSEITEAVAGEGVAVENVQMLDGGIRHANMVSFHGAFVNEAIQQDLTTTAAGPNTAISTSAYFTAITTGAGGANAITLAASSIPGVLKKIQLVVDAADAVITVAGSSGLATITLNDAGDYVILIAMQNLGWRCIENSGCTLAS